MTPPVQDVKKATTPRRLSPERGLWQLVEPRGHAAAVGGFTPMTASACEITQAQQNVKRPIQGMCGHKQLPTKNKTDSVLPGLVT